MGDWVWQPEGDYLERSRIRRFMDRHGISTWQELIRRSVEETAWFWPAIIEDLGVEWFQPYDRLYDDSQGMPWTKWFIGGKINIVHNCLDRHIRDGLGDKVALFWEGDGVDSNRLTYQELFESVNGLAVAMKRAGIQADDVVGMCMPISFEAVIVMFAAMKIGAVCMQVAARSAPQDVVECLRKGETRMLFIQDAYLRAGKRFDMNDTLQAALDGVPTLTHVVAVQRFSTASTREWAEIRAADRRVLDWNAFLASEGATPATETEALDAEHRALILFSSGTTGRSKAIVHTHGGALAQVVKEIGYAFDCHPQDVFYWFTNIGWMMAPWEIIGALFFGASVVLYEGTHLYPTPHRLFELIEKYGITIAGLTPTAMRSLAKLHEDFTLHDLSSLRILGSTGEPLDPETWGWYFWTFGQGRCPIMNISGGTELIGCLLSPLPVMPQKPGTLGGPGLGMDVDLFDEEGKPVRGRPGLLVCKKPFPSMTRGFLGEPERFLQTYFPWGPNLWVHGDRAEVDADGLWYILGRADDLIVSGGVKHDPAKIEAALISFPGLPRVREAAAIGVQDPLKGQRIVGLVVLEGDPQEGTLHELIAALTAHVGRVYDPMGRPEEIHRVSALPKNLAAKIPRGLIRRAYEGEPLGDLSKMDNPQVLDEIARLGRETTGQSREK
ncbi:MAG: AMP-binding protein [Candidatus Tectomicrobia bacterium]|uniref:acetate--CoA ligase n=1 Tax=Tectimicrobiota bacterium TaxID=2528274 RepID=A0A932CLN5_UNCTE|nr:AMP-binding protein [Candidatus Tectomicrobia bacterium]